jgi:hypothetical protein
MGRRASYPKMLMDSLGHTFPSLLLLLPWSTCPPTCSAELFTTALAAPTHVTSSIQARSLLLECPAVTRRPWPLPRTRNYCAGGAAGQYNPKRSGVVPSLATFSPGGGRFDGPQRTGYVRWTLMTLRFGMGMTTIGNSYACGGCGWSGPTRGSGCNGRASGYSVSQMGRRLTWRPTVFPVARLAGYTDSNVVETPGARAWQRRHLCRGAGPDDGLREELARLTEETLLRGACAKPCAPHSGQGLPARGGGVQD